MGQGRQQAFLHHLRRILGVPDEEDPTDRMLLERFAATRDEDAFAALVRRHGALVWGVCWRSLRHAQDTEDCFQATFLVLARRASSVRWDDSVANWLYGVASRVAAEARAKRAKRAARERQDLLEPDKSPVEGVEREYCAILDEELSRLPANCRAPLLTCYLEGRTTHQAARELGWSQRTFERRLALGRELLRARLTRRGVTLSAGLLGAFLAGSTAGAEMPGSLAATTAGAAIAKGTAVSGAVLHLVDAVSRGLGMTKLKIALLLLLLIGSTLGPALLLRDRRSTDLPIASLQEVSVEAPPAPPPEADPAERKAALPGDPFVDRIWAILQIVEKNHRQPPSRQEMLAGAFLALAKAREFPPPADLKPRLAAVDGPERLGRVLRELWPEKAAEGPGASPFETAFLDGMLATVPGKPCLLPSNLVKIHDQLRGNRYVGIGVQIRANEEEKLPQIVVPFRRGAAHRAGVLPGDLILEANGISLAGMLNMSRVVDLLRGDEGSPVSLVVRQPGTERRRAIELTRAALPLDSLFGFERQGEQDWNYRVDAEAGIAYVWVKSIKSSTLHELRQLERRLQAEGMRALVLDFRFSCGDGMLHDAGLVAGALLDGDLMWKTRDGAEPPKTWYADCDPLFRSWPLAVLVNGIEDNAHGAVLAALQDNRRAILVGEPLKNDGAVRRLFDVPNHSVSIPLVTGRLERADETRRWPVRPDCLIELTENQRGRVQKWLMDKQLPVLPPGVEDRSPNDPQLAAAVVALRDALKRGDSKAAPIGEGGNG